jgi:hypothetical protein
MNRVTICSERRLVDHFGHGRVSVNGRMDFLAGEFLIKGEAHFCDEFGSVFTNDVGS